MDVNTKHLRKYLIEKFSVEEFEAFLFDYFPPVHNDITPGMKQSERIQHLLEHCRNNERFPDLLANLEREKPGSFHPQDFSNTLYQSEGLGIEGNLSIRVFRNNPPPAGTSENTMIWQKTGQEMVRIPAGEFLYGEDKETVYLDEFWIAKTPVTNAEYARFVVETGHEPPSHWRNTRPPDNIMEHPVVQVSWHDAKAYANWAGADLPTEHQWEKAARGVDGRYYPWGNDWREKHCNIQETGIEKTTPVGEFSPQGDSPYGCVDMSGNVWEWTASKWEEGLDRRVLCGGSWLNNQGIARASCRGNIAPDSRSYRAGFRVVVRRLLS